MFLGWYTHSCFNGRITIPIRWTEKFDGSIYISDYSPIPSYPHLTIVPKSKLDTLVAQYNHLHRVPMDENKKQVYFLLENYIKSFSECRIDVAGRIVLDKERLIGLFGASTFQASLVGIGDEIEFSEAFIQAASTCFYNSFNRKVADQFSVELDRLLRAPGVEAPQILDREPVIFLSYSSKDSFIVRRLARLIESWGCQVLVDEWFIRPGDSLHQSVGAAIENSDIVICFVSKHTVESKWFKQELVEALAKREEANSNLVIIPCVLDETKAPPFLRDYLYIPFTPNTYKSSIRRLALSIRSRFCLSKLDQIVETEEARSVEELTWRFDLDLDLD